MWLNKLDSKTCAGHLGLFWRIVMAVLILLESNGMTWDFIKCFVIKKILGLQGKTGDSYSDKIEKNVFSPSGVISAVDSPKVFNFFLSFLYTV